MFFDRLKNFILRKVRNQSINQSPINQSITNQSEIFSSSKGMPEMSLPSTFPSLTAQQNTTDELLKDYFQLGLAAGYTGRSLRSIDDSLVRIESQMATKEWVNAQINEKLEIIIDFLKKHEENAQKRFETLSNLLSKLIGAPLSISNESTKTFLSKPLAVTETITPRMQALIEIVKQNKEMSYTDLANALGITENGLRGLLSNVIKRTSSIQRFKRNGKGWVRFVD